MAPALVLEIKRGFAAQKLMVRHKRKYSEPMKFATDHTLKHDYWYGQERTGCVVCVDFKLLYVSITIVCAQII
jgi:hypothetical protein